MIIDSKLAGLVGEWKGTNRLHTTWMPVKVRDSDSTASVRLKMNGQFMTIEYVWSFDGETQEGILLLGCDPRSDAVQAVFTDSWHSQNTLMLCNGTIDDNGRVSVFGTYPTAPGEPDWGWRTEITPDDDGFRYAMYNVTPEGDEEIAVETNFKSAS